MKHAVLLGAGFSRFCSPHMPLTDELGELVAERLVPPIGDMPSTFRNGAFEAWLSRLAEDQPYFSASENLTNRADFTRVSQVVRDVMVEAERTVLREPPPTGMRRLVTLLHHCRSTVITFNYDTLLERAATAQRLFDTATNETVRGEHTISSRPSEPFTGYALVASAAKATTFRLLKLHGSTDTFWVTGDATGATINRFGGLSWEPPTDDSERRRTALPDRSPFIVPPAATKSSFYANPLTRQLWLEAAEALAEADIIDIVGYSLPASDLVVSGMLTAQVQDTQAQIRVVNPDAGGVVDRLRGLGIDGSRIAAIDGADAVDAWHNAMESSAAEIALSDANLPSTAVTDDPIVVGQNRERGAACIDFTYDNGTDEVALILEAAGPTHHFNRSRGVDDPEPRRLANLGDHRTSATRFSVRFTDGSCAPVIEIRQVTISNTGHHGSWLQFVPASMPDST